MTMRARKLLTLFALLSGLSLLSGCESFHFYKQAIAGQTRLLWQREATEKLLSGEIEPELRDRLELAGRILRYAEEFGLEAEGAYASYVSTGKPYVVWNVFAADPVELALMTSCFPVAGCVSYRGYFHEQDARRYADKLAGQGYDVYVGGVSAYSTLGWFDDPLLDTFLFRDEAQLAALLFHELAHRLVYVKGDTRFNESLATALEQFVLEAYLREQNRTDVFDRYLASRRRQSEVIALINDVRGELRSLYSSELSRERKLARKEALFEVLVERYADMAGSWHEGTEYRHWMLGPMNNAKLETVADYHEWVPVMHSKLQALGFPGFIAWLEGLAELPESERHARLQAQRQSSK